MRVSAGSTIPTPPAMSTRPIDRTNSTGSCPAQGIIFASSGMGVVSFMKPIITNGIPTRSCAIQRPRRNAIESILSCQFSRKH